MAHSLVMKEKAMVTGTLLSETGHHDTSYPFLSCAADPGGDGLTTSYSKQPALSENQTQEKSLAVFILYIIKIQLVLRMAPRTR